MKETISLEIKQPRLPAMSIGDTKIIDGTGENGATFYPSVSADGVISWTNNKGLENPKPVNIRGGNGKDGYSPTINISKLPNGNRVTINDKNGTEYIDILNGADGQNGADGVGIKSVEKTATNGEFDTYTFNFTDGKTFSFTIKNGKDGEDGTDGRGISSIVKSSANGLIDNYTINFTDGSKTTFSVTNGKNGVDGTDGKDGTPATHEWQGTRLVITSASGTSSADLKGERGIQGIQGEKGDPFFISKVYNSVAEMHADYSNNEVKVGQFVVIETGNVNDEDNAKLFIKGNTSYEFLTDLSGAQGMQGPAGVQGEQGDQGPAGVQGVGIRSIAKTDTQGIQDIYTITLTDSSTATFSVTNGTNGNDGVSVTNASIDSNGNLVISLSNGNELTLGKVVGSNGKDGADGTSVTIERIDENTSDGGSSTIFFSDGNSINIKNGATGGKGADGTNGTSVTITKVTESTEDGGSNVVDFSDGKSLSVKNGSKGSTGVGISKVAKTATSGRVDTYTITFTDGTTSTFTVTNGKDGEGANIDLSELFTVDKVATVDTYANGATNIIVANNGVTWRDVMSFSDGADFIQEATALFKVPFIAGKNMAFELDGEAVKINLAEVINNLTTNSTDKPLSAAQGVALKALIDALPSWAKEANKPSYTPSEVGAVPTSRTVNGKALSSNITLSASDVGADASGTASSAVSAHNTNTSAHNDLRLMIEGLTARLDALANSTDDDLDQMAEIVTYIKANKELIDSITTSKVSVADIVNNLTSNVTNKPLSAAQGMALKKLIDAITVPTKVSQLINDSGYLTQHQDLSTYAKTANHYTKTESDNKYQAKGNYLTAVPSEYVTETELNNKGYLTAHQDISGKADKSSAETWTFKLKDGSTVTKKVVLA